MMEMSGGNDRRIVCEKAPNGTYLAKRKNANQPVGIGDNYGAAIRHLIDQEKEDQFEAYRVMGEESRIDRQLYPK